MKIWKSTGKKIFPSIQKRPASEEGAFKKEGKKRARKPIATYKQLNLTEPFEGICGGNGGNKEKASQS